MHVHTDDEINDEHLKIAKMWNCGNRPFRNQRRNTQDPFSEILKTYCLHWMFSTSERKTD